MVNTNGLKVTVGSAVYIEEAESSTVKRSGCGLSIVRVVDLKIGESGHKFAYCYQYLRPDQVNRSMFESYYRKEVIMVTPIEIAFKVPLDTMKGVCSVIDVSSYVKGRPKYVDEKDVYVCEYKINCAGIVTKIQPSSLGHWCYAFPNQASFSFDMFETKWKIVRNYQVRYLIGF